MSYPQDEALFDAPTTEPQEAPTPTGTDLADAAEQTIKALEFVGALDESHSLKVALIRVSARALDREMGRDKITVAATSLMTTMVATVNELPSIGAAASEQFDRLAAIMSYEDQASA